MKVTFIAVALALLVASVAATTYFEEDFSSGSQGRWVLSDNKVDEELAGKLDLSTGKYFTEDSNKGLRTTEDARFYTISAQHDSFSNKDTDLVVQYTVKHEQNIDCGGGYVKLLPASVDQKTFNGDSEYNIMFGPDICGVGHRIVHFILNHDGENHLVTRNPAAKSDEFTHTYTLHLRSDNTYTIYVDAEEEQTGSIEDDFTILPPKKINDPTVSKPEDWVDEPMMDDPEDTKPEGYDDIPAMIEDPESTKPSDWDDDLDGEWETAMMPNPEYQGPWRAARIENPEYKGEWEHPQVDNPDYAPDATLYAYDNFSAVGIEVWQVKSGTIFSNFLISDDIDAALEAAKKLNTIREAEEAQAAEVAAEEAAAAEAAAAAAAAAEADEEEEHDDL